MNLDILLTQNQHKVFHLGIKPENLAQKIIIVGDPDRVPTVSSHFDSIEFDHQTREFRTITGIKNNTPITVISSGIGSGNIDILMTELDLLANYDFEKNIFNPQHNSLQIVRIGTTGSFQETIQPGTIIDTVYGIGLDGLLNQYGYEGNIQEQFLRDNFIASMHWPQNLAKPYTAEKSLDIKIPLPHEKGITLTSPGFYGSQFRKVKVSHIYSGDILQKISHFVWEGWCLTNMEMETACIFGMSKLLGHKAASFCLVLANRITGEVLCESKDEMQELICTVVDELAGN